MTEEIWFEDSLRVPEKTQSSIQRAGKISNTIEEKRALEKAGGKVIAHKPRSCLLTKDDFYETPIPWKDVQGGGLVEGEICLVRLGLEFVILREAKLVGWSYTEACCRTYLYSPRGQAQPRAFDIFPKRHFEAPLTSIDVESGFKLKAGSVDASLLQVGGKIYPHRKTPTMLGYFGEEESSPYWELKAETTPIQGTYFFWLLVECPPSCSPVRLSMIGDGDLQSNLFGYSIPIVPKETAWSKRKSISICTEGDRLE